MVTVLRTNAIANPSFEIDTSGVLTTASIASVSSVASFPLVGTRSMSVTLTASPSSGAAVAQPVAVPVAPGQWVGVRVSARPSSWSGRIRARVLWYDAGAANIGSSAFSDYVTAPNATYSTVVHAVQAPAGTASARAYLYLHASASDTPPASVPTASDAWMAAVAATEAAALAAVGTYFDGNTPDGPILPDGSRLVYDWTGTANASPSTESRTDAVITANLITSAGSPPPVQVVLNGIPDGAEYVVTGSTGAGSSWPVPGGTGVGTGSQIVLVDNRSALNTPVTYSVVVNGVTYSADPVTVVHDGKAVLQSLDGLTSVDFVWLSNSLPREPQINAATFNVPGRRRPPVRYAPGGDGGGELLIRADRANNAEINDLLRSGRPILVRTDGTMRDWPAVDLILLTGAPSRLWEAVENGELSTQRVWSLPFLFVDDPEPSRALSAWTWDDHDEAALASFDTYDAFDALFAGSTWDGFDTTEWGQYQ